MNAIQSTASFPLPPRVRSAFYSLESADSLALACDIQSECVHLLQALLDSGLISAHEYIFYSAQLAARLASLELSLGGAV